MKPILMALIFSIAVLVPALNKAQTPPDPAGVTIESRLYEIDLGGGFTTQAALTYPAEGNAPYPTVVLLHGSGPYDMDASVSNIDGSTLSQNFKRIAETLPAHGFAVLRYNKRGVSADGSIDWEQVQLSTVDQLAADVSAVIDGVVGVDDPIDRDALYLYGWSEGAVVAANAAASRDDITGVILQGAPNGDLSTVLPYQHIEIGLPYLTDVIDGDADGALSLDEIATIPSGSVQLMPAFYMYAYTSTPENPQLNPQTDVNADGLIQIEDELRPAVERTLAMYSQFIPPTEASWAVADLLMGLDIPVLILHGEMDGWVSSRMGEEIASALGDRATLHLYPALGHALSETTRLAEDGFGIMADDPLTDLAAWLIAQ